MSSIRPPRATAPRVSAVPATTGARRASEPGPKLADLGVYGFDRFETAILAALVTEDPLLLVGRSGTGKTFLLNTLSEALGLDQMAYLLTLANYCGVVRPRPAAGCLPMVRFVMTPRSVVQSNPEILGGEPVFAGTRVPVRNLIDYLEHGSSLDDFLTDFPSVTREQAVSVLEMAREAAGREAAAG
jgi:uncharacterized protein (DUF433 family)